MSTTSSVKKASIRRKLLKSDQSDEKKIGPSKKKRPRSVGILGYPKKSKVIYFFNKKNNESAIFSSSNDEDDDEDIDFICEPIKISSSIHSTPTRLKKTKSSNNHSLDLISSKPIEIIETKEYDSKSNWSNGLPYEILLKIFRYYTTDLNGNLKHLEQLSSVCKYWFTVSQDPSLWSSLRLSNLIEQKYVLNEEKNAKSHNHQMSPSKENQKILSKFELRLNDFLKKNSSTLNERVNKFQYITKLNLSYLCYLTCDMLNEILSKCNSSLLVHLDLSHCKRINISRKCEDKMPLLFEKCIADRCFNLKSLNLTGLDKQININTLCYLFNKLGASLEDINLSQTVISSNTLNTLFNSCSNLKKIDISNSTFKGVLNLDLMSQKCLKLKSLFMLKCYPKIKNETIESVVKNHSSSHSSNDSSLPYFSSYANLNELSISFDRSKFGTDPMFILLLKICIGSSNLQSLDVRSYRSPLNSFFNLFDHINTNSLERLYLCNSNFSEADSIYFSSIIFEKWYKTLIELDLSWSNISAQSLNFILEVFIKKSNECKLKYLNLTGTSVETEMVIKLAKNVKTLNIVNLASCRSVDRGMKRTLSRQDFNDII